MSTNEHSGNIVGTTLVCTCMPTNLCSQKVGAGSESNFYSKYRTSADATAYLTVPPDHRRLRLHLAHRSAHPLYHLSFRYKYYSPTTHQDANPNNYGRALLSAPPQAIAPNPHTNLLNVYIQLANKMGFQPKKNITSVSNKMKVTFYSFLRPLLSFHS
jgi:hypothetical protein